MKELEQLIKIRAHKIEHQHTGKNFNYDVHFTTERNLQGLG